MPWLLWVLGAMLVLLAAFFLAVYIKIFSYFTTRGRAPTNFYEYFLSQFPSLTARPFTCPSGGETLSCIQLQYSESPKALIVMVHGLGWNMEHYFPQAEYMARAGYSIILFDGVGIGRSSGAQLRGMPQHVLDVSAVLDYVESTPDLAALPLMLYGHSWGGYAANSVSCKKRYPLCAIASVSAYIEPVGTMTAALRRRFSLLGLIVSLPLARYQRKTFGKAGDGYMSTKGLSLADCPVLVMHSEGDEDLPFQDSFAAMEKALDSKSKIRFLAFEGKNHNLGIPGDVNKQRRELQRKIRKISDPVQKEKLLQELWALQMIIDESILEILVSFYDESLKNESTAAL